MSIGLVCWRASKAWTSSLRGHGTDDTRIDDKVWVVLAVLLYGFGESCTSFDILISLVLLLCFRGSQKHEHEAMESGAIVLVSCNEANQIIHHIQAHIKSREASWKLVGEQTYPKGCFSGGLCAAHVERSR